MKNKKGKRNESHSDQHGRDNAGRFTSEHTYHNMAGRNNSDNYYDRSNSYSSDNSRHDERQHSLGNQHGNGNYESDNRVENFRSNGNHSSSNGDRMNGNHDSNYGSRNDNSNGRSYDTNNLNGYDSDYRNTFNDNDDYRENSERRDEDRSSMNGQSNHRSSTGQFRGRGPKGYQRSDDRIKEEINDRLTDDDQLDASELEVTVEKGEVTLSGSVSARNDKRRAEDIVESVSGVNHVENRIRITRGSQQQQSDKSETKSKSNKHTSEVH